MAGNDNQNANDRSTKHAALSANSLVAARTASRRRADADLAGPAPGGSRATADRYARDAETADRTGRTADWQAGERMGGRTASSSAKTADGYAGRRSGSSSAGKHVRSGEPRSGRSERKGTAEGRAGRTPDGRRQGRANTGRASAGGAAGHPQTLGEFIRRNILYISSVVLVVSVAVLLMIGVRTFILPDSQAAKSPQNSSDEAVPADVLAPTHDWDNLEFVEGRPVYRVNGQVVSRLGVDVSENQHSIDWNAVAADGIDFAIIRLGYRGATEGKLYVDDYFEEYLEGAKDAGLDCGVYFFSQARTVDEAVEEAEFVLKHLDGRTLEYPIAFDSEQTVEGVEQTRTADLDDETMTAVAEAFCARIEQAGYSSIIYGNGIDLARYIRESLDGQAIWWAEYDVSIPSAPMDIHLWQYSHDGTVDGISTGADMNIDF